MKVLISAIVVCMLPMSAPLRAQASERPPAQETKQIPSERIEPPAPGQNSEMEGDLFPQLRGNADLLRSRFEEINGSNTKTIERLRLTQKCQITRVVRLLDDTKNAMQQWLDAEKQYWQAWNEKETKRADGQQKALAVMEEEQKDLANLMEEEKKNEEQLERNKAAFENSKRTEESRAEIDRLIREIRDSQARLADANQKYDALSVRIKEAKSLLSTRLVKVRQNIQSLEAYTFELSARYASVRAEAEEICNMKKPTSRAPLPKSGAK